MNNAESIIDVASWSPGLNPSSDWRVDDRKTHSDHLAIQYRVEHGGRRSQPKVIDRHRGWLTSRFDKPAFVERLIKARKRATPCGDANRVVISETKGALTSLEILQKIVETLFPRYKIMDPRPLSPKRGCPGNERRALRNNEAALS